MTSKTKFVSDYASSYATLPLRAPTGKSLRCRTDRGEIAIHPQGYSSPFSFFCCCSGLQFVGSRFSLPLLLNASTAYKHHTNLICLPWRYVRAGLCFLSCSIFLITMSNGASFSAWSYPDPEIHASNDELDPWRNDLYSLRSTTSLPEDAAFKPRRRFYLAFSSLTILAMMVSLDGTSVSVALPVSPLPPCRNLSSRFQLHSSLRNCR